MEQEQSLTVVEQPGAIMPVMDIEGAVTRFKRLYDFARRILKPDVDYGTIPGVHKDTLYKAGAEKIIRFFGLTVELNVSKRIEDWTGAEHGGESLFHYEVDAYLSKDGNIIAIANGSCNSWESKYRWRWVGEHDLPPGLDPATLKWRGGTISEFDFAVDKAETVGQYGKPAEHWQKFKDAIKDGTARQIQKKTRKGQSYKAWEIDSTQYRIPNDDIHSQVNTILKMAGKRAYVAVTLLGTAASELYTQDVEDFAPRDTNVKAAVPDLSAERDAVKKLWVALAGQLGLVSLPVDMDGGKKLKAMLGSLYDSLGGAQTGLVQLADKGVTAIINYHIAALKLEPMTESSSELKTVESADERRRQDQLDESELPGGPGQAPHYSDN